MQPKPQYPLALYGLHGSTAAQLHIPPLDNSSFGFTPLPIPNTIRLQFRVNLHKNTVGKLLEASIVVGSPYLSAICNEHLLSRSHGASVHFRYGRSHSFGHHQRCMMCWQNVSSTRQRVSHNRQKGKVHQRKRKRRRESEGKIMGIVGYIDS